MIEINANSSEITLEQAKIWLRQHYRNGAICPCCNQVTKMYKRPINKSMVKTLVLLRDQTDWFHLNEIGDARHFPKALCVDFPKLRHWGLVEKMMGRRDDGSSRLGYWRITDMGRSFIQNGTSVAKRAVIYNGVCMGFDGELVRISDVLRGEGFNYAELMNA